MKKPEAPLKAAAAVRRLVKLSDAARTLGCHVETLRLRVRRGEIAATRGPRGTYYVTREAMRAIRPIQRSGRRRLNLGDYDWSWVALESKCEELGLGLEDIETIRHLQEEPSLNERLHGLLSVHRLRIAGLSTIEIATLLELPDRQVRRLSARDFVHAVERSPLLEERDHRHAVRTARRVVAAIQLRLEECGFRYHQRRWQSGDEFTPRRRAPATKAKKLFREEVRHLRSAGLTLEEINAILVVGIGQDELNELILRGLRDEPLP